MRNPFVAAMMMAVAISRAMIKSPGNYAGLDSSNCGVAKNGGRRHTVAQDKRAALKDGARNDHKRQCRGRGSK